MRLNFLLTYSLYSLFCKLPIVVKNSLLRLIFENEWKLILNVDKKNEQVSTSTGLFNMEINPYENKNGNLIEDPEQKLRIERLINKYNAIKNKQ